MTKKTKHEISLTAGQAGEVLAPIIEVVLGMTSQDAQYWIGKKGKLANEVRKILIQSNSNKYSDLLSDWQNFWKGIDGKDRDFSNIRIPEKPEGNWRLLVIDDIALEALYVKCKEKFKCWRWTIDNFDKVVIYNERDAKNGAYVVWASDEVEADKKYKNLSTNRIKEMGIKTETLAERLIHELKFFAETGNHLDIKNVTLCAGSRCGDGDIPSVHWISYYSGMRVNGCGPGNAASILRVREVVS